MQPPPTGHLVTTSVAAGSVDAPGTAVVRPASSDASNGWLVLVGVGAVLSLASAASNDPKLRAGLLAITGALSIAGIAVGTLRSRPRSPGMWWGLVAAMAILTTGTVIAAVNFTDHRHEAILALQVAQLVGYPIFFVCIMAASRTRRPFNEIDSLLDGLILGTAFGFFTWRSLLSQAVAQSSASGFELLIANAIPALDIIVIVALLRRVLSAARVSPSLRLIVCAMLVATTNHLISGLAVANLSSLVDHAPLQGLAFATARRRGAPPVHEQGDRAR